MSMNWGMDKENGTFPNNERLCTTNRDDILMCDTTEINIKNVKINTMLRQEYYIWLYSSKISKTGKSIETECQWVVA